MVRGSLDCLVGCHEWSPPLPVAASRGDTRQSGSLEYFPERDGRVLELEPIKGVIHTC